MSLYGEGIVFTYKFCPRQGACTLKQLFEAGRSERGAEEAVLHLAIVAARADDQEIDQILKSHGVEDILY